MRSFLLITILAVAFLLINILVVSQISTSGRYLADLEDKTTVVAEENSVLEQGVDEATSLATISALAQSIGFSRTQVIYATGKLPVAMEKIR
ncbi:hypothetical protein FJZ40_02700 [Candidatus Shapirobacteria bacterium]|nr:hypothetical protein [Candidatus Shapirobacteria bacterium]